MHDDDILIGSLIEESWLTLEQVAAACTVEPEWLLAHIEEGCFRMPRAWPGYGASRPQACCGRVGCGNWSAASMRCPNLRR